MHIFVFIFFILAFLFPWRWLFCARNARKASVPANWPVVGMVPGLLTNFGRLHDAMSEVLEQSGSTLFFKGPSFTNIDMLVTCDPANVHYVLAKNSPNFGRGPDFREMVDDILGDGIIAAESESWENQSRLVKSAMSFAKFKELTVSTAWQKTETGLIPILEYAAKNETEVDLQQLFKRFTFDCACMFVLGNDPGSLCLELPHLTYLDFFACAEEAILYRNVLPEAVWKMQRWLRIGREEKLIRATESFHRFLSYCISLKRENLKPTDADHSVLTSCMRAVAEKGDAATNVVSEKFLVELMISLMFAGKDTISAALCWFLWLLATNPTEQEKIRDEITATSPSEPAGNWKFSNKEVLNKMLYLHGAACETLRLFPPLALQHRAPIRDDVLPSGHRIKANTRTILSFYSMGRMESIWGKDCHQFKPERWIADDGQIKVEPPHKFSAFGTGPRSCLGKDIAFVEMKIIAAAILSRFNIEAAKGHPVEPSASAVIHMKYGLKVKLSRRV